MSLSFVFKFCILWHLQFSRDCHNTGKPVFRESHINPLWLFFSKFSIKQTEHRIILHIIPVSLSSHHMESTHGHHGVTTTWTKSLGGPFAKNEGSHFKAGLTPFPNCSMISASLTKSIEIRLSKPPGGHVYFSNQPTVLGWGLLSKIHVKFHVS